MSGIKKWDTSNVENMTRMFKGAENFKQDLSGWNVEKIKERPEGFCEREVLNEDFEPLWGRSVSPPDEEKPEVEEPSTPELETPNEVPEVEIPETDIPEGVEETDPCECQCYATGITVKEYPALDEDGIVAFRAMNRIICFENYPLIMTLEE